MVGTQSQSSLASVASFLADIEVNGQENAAYNDDRDHDPNSDLGGSVVTGIVSISIPVRRGRR